MSPTAKFDAHFRGVSRYFSPEEIRFLGASNAAGPAKGLNTLPPESLWFRIEETLEMADDLREFYGEPIKILSAYRSPEYNKAISGASKSFHTKFMALDLAPTRPSIGNIQRLRGCAELLVKKGVLTGGVGRYSWGVHLDCGPRRDW